MTTIAFIAMTLTDKFDLANAFTTMYLFQYLSFAIIMLPMILTMLTEANISAQRIEAFLTLGNKDPGVMVHTEDMTHEEIEKLPEKARDNTIAITVEGKPSFCWGLAADKVVPPVLDPFFKENQITMKNINKIF